MINTPFQRVLEGLANSNNANLYANVIPLIIVVMVVLKIIVETESVKHKVQGKTTCCYFLFEKNMS